MWTAETWQEVFAALLQPLPLIVILLGRGILFFIAFASGLAHAAAKYSRRNMSEESRKKIDQLSLRLHDAETESTRCLAENRVLWARYQALVALATKPLEFDQERALLEIDLRLFKARK